VAEGSESGAAQWNAWRARGARAYNGSLSGGCAPSGV